jgi:hypothetical protein
MSTPLTSAGPTALTDSGQVADGSGRASWVADSIETNAWIAGLSPAGATVYDTGYVTPTLAGATGGSGYGIVRRGKRVTARGQIAPTTNWGAAGTAVVVIAAGGIPAEMRPASAQIFLASGGSTTSTVLFRVVVGSDGSLTINCNTASSTSSMWLTAITYEL